MNIHNNQTHENLSIWDSLGEKIIKKNKIDPQLYEQYNVKRGLRNSDGTGVLVGLTEVGDVHSYIIDEGEKIPVEGVLRYRGIDVVDFVDGFEKEKRFGFEECCFLLLFGYLPESTELSDFKELLGRYRMLPENFTEDMILKAASPDIMNKLARCVLASYSYDKNPEDMSASNIIRQCVQLIAAFPTMVAHAYEAKLRYYQGESLYLHSPKTELSTAENTLRLIRPGKDFLKEEAEMLDLMMVLHAEHGGGNNSTFSIRVVSSTGTDTYSAMAAAVGSLKGPLHGGANLKVMEMMEDIKTNVKDWANEAEVREYLVKILTKKAFDKSGLIYGIGHAVYTLSDPRAILLKRKAQILCKIKGMENEYNLYTLVEKLAPETFYEVKKSDKIVCANVDFYSGFVYKMLNIPMELYTPLFAISRVAGWSAHRLEEVINGGRIIRPAYKCVSKKTDYIEISKR